MLFTVEGYDVTFKTQGTTRMYVSSGNKQIGKAEVPDYTPLTEVILMAEELINFYEAEHQD